MALGPRGMRFVLNLYPPYLFSRTRILSIAPDWKEIVVVLRKSLLTRNYVGTAFGGSLYAATDPFFMLMLIKIFGIEDYIIWDKGAHIDFKRPVRSDLTYRFQIADQDLNAIRQDLEHTNKVIPEFEAKGIDEDGQVCIVVRKILYIRRKDKK